MVWGYGLYSLGELLVSGLGLAMIARYVPARMGGFMMGAYFVASGLSQYLGSVVANLAHIPEGLSDPLESLAIYTSSIQQARLRRRRLYRHRDRHAAAHESAIREPLGCRRRTTIRFLLVRSEEFNLAPRGP